MKRRGIYASLLAGVAFFFPLAAFGIVSFPQPQGHVSDIANILSAETRQGLERDLQSFAKGGNPQIVVVTVPSLDGDDIESVANRLFREWGIGGKEKNNGVLFLISSGDRKMRIEVGYGLEGTLTDIESKHIQTDVVQGSFQAGNFDDGVRRGVQKIKEAISAELQPAAKKRSGMTASALETLFFLGFLVLSWLGSLLGRSKSWWLGGILGGLGGLVGGVITGLFWIIVPAAALGFLFDYFVSKNYLAHLSNHHPAWWAGGSWGGWDRFGGGGFGGFGGGSSGGGGSSSTW